MVVAGAGPSFGQPRGVVNLFAWIALGAISGYTAFHLSPVDPTIGASGQALLAIAGSFAAGLLGSAALGVDPFAARIDMAVGWLAVVGSVIAVVGREEALQRSYARSQRVRRRGGAP